MDISESEVARIRRQIGDEYIAAKLAMDGFAVTARHEFITTKMQNIAACHQELVKLVGKKEATKVMAETTWEPADRQALEQKES
ncbi:MAG: hypothetical protein JOZ18_10650 [Chloroflexi bacterium]|nr:hypothetical protein [Chloroflexota bacterium]